MPVIVRVFVSGLCLAIPSLAASPAPAGFDQVPEASAESFVLQAGALAESQSAQLKIGKWKTVGVQNGATTMPPQVVAQVMPGEMQFDEEKIVITLQAKKAGEVPYTVDETVSPARLTIDGALVANAPPAKRVKSTVIFRVDGDKLEICVGPNPAEPPADFKPTAENNWTLITYERVK